MPDQPLPAASITVGKKNLSLDQASAVLHRTAGWFLWIGGISVANTLATMAQQKYRLALGLGITDLTDALFNQKAKQMEAGLMAVHLAQIGVVCCFAGLFVLLWHYAKKGSRAAFLTGIIIYSLDALIFLLLHDVIGILLHGYVLFMLLGGYTIAGKLKHFQHSPPPPPPIPAPAAEPAQGDEA